MMGVMQTNRQNILDAIARLKVNVDLLEQALQSDDSGKIQSILDEACAKHKRFL